MVANMQPPRLPVSETDRRRRHQTKMELGWNNARPDARPEGEKTKPNTSHSGQGLEIKETFSTSGRGRKMFLTSPLIDQALSLRRKSRITHLESIGLRNALSS